ncbi:hypothetical protein ACFV1U_34725 [Streptomyces microflavus]|uniref:hypothetical protein n=1 Tax=Streptomyces microflavus TaxID=1919 RepID=UPI0036737AAE
MLKPLVRPHPLAEYAERIDAQRTYTLRDLAELMELSSSSVTGMARYGWLPGSRVRSHRRGGRMYTWAGRELVRLSNKPLVVEYDHERYAASTLYRVGCRCVPCTRAHNTDSVARSRALAEDVFPRAKRDQVIALVTESTPVAVAAATAGVTLGTVYGRAAWDADFADALDEAGWSLCVSGQESPECGTPCGYRGNPRGPSPRPACRGTGCREWRRGQSRIERGAAV